MFDHRTKPLRGSREANRVGALTQTWAFKLGVVADGDLAVGDSTAELVNITMIRSSSRHTNPARSSELTAVGWADPGAPQARAQVI
jgi:hypothetical protein